MSKGDLNELALCAAAGGGLLATEHLLGFKTVCYVEHDLYRVEVLKARIQDKFLDNAPIWDDCRTFDGKPWCGLVDIVSAGFPCQPFTEAGKRLGADDPRNIWPDVVRIIGEARPKWVLLENSSKLLAPFRVAGRTTAPAYISRVLADLAEIGYVGRYDCIPASAVGAPHQRDRIWIVAYASSLGLFGSKAWQSSSHQERDNSPHQCSGETVLYEVEPGGEICNSAGERLPNGIYSQMGGSTEGTTLLQSKRSNWWAAEPELGRVAHGVAHRVDRLAAIGDGQVPAVVRAAWDALS
jgi:DNA (cytosine-5)-methyltransferase 1